MTAVIEVAPAPTIRRDFARWAGPHQIRTLTPQSFAIPTDLFTDLPEPLLAGATVDGQPWITPTPSAPALTKE